MSDEEKKQPSPDETKLALDGRSVDWYLQSLVSLVNKSNIEFGITLFVEGLTISGQVVSGRKYFETFAKEFSGAYPGNAESQENIRQALASRASIYDHKDSDGTPPPPQFIHLVNCRCFSSGGVLPNNRGVLWRGKINAVSGFSLGSLSSE
jgi:hypothetical protein